MATGNKIKNVYGNDLIDGELVPRSDGKLDLKLVIRKAMANKVNRSMVSESNFAAVAALNNDLSTDVGASDTVVPYVPSNIGLQMISSYGDEVPVTWVEKQHFSPDEEKAYSKKRADKSSPGFPIFRRKPKATRHLFHRGSNRPISEVIATLIKAQDDKQRKLPKSASRNRSHTTVI